MRPVLNLLILVTILCTAGAVYSSVGAPVTASAPSVSPGGSLGAGATAVLGPSDPSGISAAPPALASGVRPTASGSASRSGEAASEVTEAPTSTSIGLWAADWGGAVGQRSAAAWQAAAENDSIMVGVPGTYEKWISQLHAWNPNLKVLAYNLGPYLQKGSAAFNTVLQNDPSWFARDANGNLINLPSFPDNYLMNPGNAAYCAWHAQQLAAVVFQDGFDGAMDDSMGNDVLGHYASAPPVDPTTGQVYTATAWMTAEVAMLDTDKAALDGKYLAFNGLVSGPQYSLISSILASSTADAGVAELFLRQPNAPVSEFPNLRSVEDSLAMMTNMAARGKAFLGWTKLWPTATPAQLSQWEQFTLAVDLLGESSSTYVDFMPSRTADNTCSPYIGTVPALGAPLGPYVQSGDTFSRQFQDGSVSLTLDSNNTWAVSV